MKTVSLPCRGLARILKLPIIFKSFPSRIVNLEEKVFHSFLMGKTAQAPDQNRSHLSSVLSERAVPMNRGWDCYIDPTVKDFIYTFFPFLSSNLWRWLIFSLHLLVKFGCGCHGHLCWKNSEFRRSFFITLLPKCQKHHQFKWGKLFFPTTAINWIGVSSLNNMEGVYSVTCHSNS